MTRKVHVGGVHGKRYHFNPKCTHLPLYDQVELAEEDATSLGYTPCAVCGDQVLCSARSCVFNEGRLCALHHWSGPNQVTPIDGCISFERSE